MAPTANASTEVRDWYEIFYRPANHPGDEHRTTVAEYRSVVNNLYRSQQFPWWCERFDNPSRGVPLVELYRDFRWWLRWCHPGGENDHQGLPVVTLDELSDTLVVGGMSFLVEVGRARTTANKLRSHINAIWNHAARVLAKEFGVTIPRPDNDEYSVDLTEPVALLPDELERLIEAARRREGMVGQIPAGIWWPAALMFVLSLGVRITAAVGIPTDKLDLTRGEVLVPAWAQKNRREQWLDLFPSVTELIRELRLRERGVATVLGDWPYTINTLRRHYKQIVADADIGYASADAVPSCLLFHCLRRTLASMLIKEHGLQVACDRLNHSSIDVTRRYHDPRYGGKPRVRDLLPDPFSAPPGPASPPPQLTLYHGEAV